MKYLLIMICTLSLSASYAESGHNHDSHKGHGHDEHEGHDHKNEKKKNLKKHDNHKHDEADHKHSHKKHDDHKGHDHEDDHHGHGDSGFGEGKAIVEVKKDGNKFRLDKDAIKSLKIKSVRLDSSFEVPASSVVDFQNEIGVYRRKKDWFELIRVKLDRRGKYSAKLKSSKLKNGDQIVSEGVPLLHVAHLQASGQGGHGHAH